MQLTHLSSGEIYLPMYQIEGDNIAWWMFLAKYYVDIFILIMQSYRSLLGILKLMASLRTVPN